MSDWTYIRGACLPALRKLPVGVAGLVLTDPPYGTGTGDSNTQYGRRQNGVAKGQAISIANDTDLSELESAAHGMLRALSSAGVALVFMGPSQYRPACRVLEGAGFHVHHSLPWDKGQPGISHRARFSYEDVILATHPYADPFEARGPIVVPLRYPRVQQSEHPNEKPVPLLRHLIRWALHGGGHVVDPFAGIASAGVAALLEGCTYWGAEIDEQWWEKGESRLLAVSDNTHGLSLFTDGAS